MHLSFLPQRCQTFARPLEKAGSRVIGDILFHHGRGDGHALDAVLVAHPKFPPGMDALGQNPLHTFLANARLPPVQRRCANRQPMREGGLPDELLIVLALDSARDHRLVLHTIGMPQIKQPSHQPRRCSKPPLIRQKKPFLFPSKHGPFD